MEPLRCSGVVLSLLLLLLSTALDADTVGSTFVHLQDRDFTIRRVSKTTAAAGPTECVLTCQLTSGCVGGRYRESSGSCDLQLHTVRRMTYKKKAQEAGDFVFGLECDPGKGYLTKPDRGIDYLNIIVLENIPSLKKCQARCSLYEWCRAIDYIESIMCNLEAVDEFEVSSTVDKGNTYSHKNCF